MFFHKNSVIGMSFFDEEIKPLSPLVCLSLISKPNQQDHDTKKKFNNIYEEICDGRLSKIF